ncbi:MAG: acyl-CoA thioesterase [Flavobacteriales bacterium]
MTLEERIKKSKTRVFKAIFPNVTNHYNTLFGGMAMLLMDEVAFITATRFSRRQMVTVGSDKVDFKKSIATGTIIELVGEVTHVGHTSLRVQVDIFVEQMYSSKRGKAATGAFSLVAIDEDKNPIPVS